MEQRILCVWLRGQEVFSSVIICRFPYSLFPICSAHIRHANSVPLAIPSVQKSRPYSEGKALGAHGGEQWADKLQSTKPFKQESNDVIWMTFTCSRARAVSSAAQHQVENKFPSSIHLSSLYFGKDAWVQDTIYIGSVWGYEGQTVCTQACSHRQKIPGNMCCNTARN